MTLAIGDRVGRLTIHSDPIRRDRRRYYLAACDCGTIREFRDDALTKGRARSCGCLARELTVRRHTTHGQSSRKIVSGAYQSWASMIQRCCNPKSRAYADYGARGIGVCKAWLNFKHFYADMGDRPEGKEIERIDNNDGYHAGNCRWATRYEQMRNTRRNLFVRLDNKEVCATDAATLIGIDPNQIFGRMRDHNVSAQEAVDFFARQA